MNDGSRLLTRTALGAAGGLAGTLALQAMMAASQKWLPGALPPLREDPGPFMVEKAEGALPGPIRGRIPEAAEKVAAGALGMGYGLTFGALYAALRPRGGDPLVDGLVLGAADGAQCLSLDSAGGTPWLTASSWGPPAGRRATSAGSRPWG